MAKYRAVLALHNRNSRLLRRRPDLLAQATLLPIVLLLLSSIIFGAGGDNWPVAVVDESRSPDSAALVDQIEQSSSRISPYFDIRETDAGAASELVNAGRLQLLIEIPDDFGPAGTVHITTYNINSDATKNLRLRVEKVLNSYDLRRHAMTVDVDLRTVAPEDVPRTTFLAGSVVILALFFGALVLTANLFAIEQEQRTTKELLLTPVGSMAGALGAIFTGTVAAYFTAIPTLLIATLAFGFRPDAAAAVQALAFMLPIMVACAGLGVIIAQLLRNYRSIHPLVIVGGIATFFVGGGFVSTAALPPPGRMFASGWPFSRIFEWNNPVLYGFHGSYSAGQWLTAVAAAGVGVALAFVAVRREHTTRVLHGQ